MLKAKLYLVGVDAKTGELMTDAEPCKLCKRMIINSGISKVVTYDKRKKIKVIDVETEWIKKNMGEVKKVNGKWVVLESADFG